MTIGPEPLPPNPRPRPPGSRPRTPDSGRPEPRPAGSRRRTSGAYRAATRLVLPRAHRDRFGDQQEELTEDLLSAGEPRWRLWLWLAGDLVTVRRWTRRPRVAVATAGGGSAAAPERGRWTRHQVLAGARATIAVTVHGGWLLGHLVLGTLWRVMVATMPPYRQDDAWFQAYAADPRLAAVSDTFDLLQVWLLLGFVVTVPLWAWLPRRWWFALAWAVLWPLGMFLLHGYNLD